jgi:hypothetical protein
VELVRVLIQVGADMNMVAKHESPLSVAIARAHIDVVLELLQCGVKHESMTKGVGVRGEGRRGKEWDGG